MRYYVLWIVFISAQIFNIWLVNGEELIPGPYVTDNQYSRYLNNGGKPHNQPRIYVPSLYNGNGNKVSTDYLGNV